MMLKWLRLNICRYDYYYYYYYFSYLLFHLQEFVDKFRYNAKRASLVQSRIKAIQKESLDLEEPEEEEKPFSFFFPDCGQLGQPVIKVDNVTFAYPNKSPLFRNVDLAIDQSSRIGIHIITIIIITNTHYEILTALVGPNGAGKSTLLNLLQGKLRSTDGVVIVNPQLRIGVFTQYHMDSFDLKLSPLQNMMNRWPLAPEAELRSHLGRYEINGNDALKPMKFSSGGQKSRTAFACLTYTKPHILLMDEPSNHLDMRTIEALIQALKQFSGGLLIISHDQHFITSVCNEIWRVEDQKITKFDGSFEDYKQVVVKALTKKQVR